MQGGQHRDINFCGARPEAAGLIMNQIKYSALPRTTPDEFDDPLLMLAITALKIIRLSTWISSRKKLAADARASRSRNCGGETSTSHFPLQSPQHLLGPASALFGN